MAMAGATGGFVMLSATRITWGFPPSWMATGLFLAIVAGLALWVTLRMLIRAERAHVLGFADAVALTAWGALLVAFGNQTVNYALQGVRGTAISGGTLALVLVALFAVTKIQKGIPRVVLAWLPAGIAVVTVIVVTKIQKGIPRVVLAWLPAGIAVVTVIVSLAGSRSPGRPTNATRNNASQNAPNIVLVILDTARADHIGFYGYERNTMPALGEWARDAAIFTRAVSPAGWTGPAHASMLSGRTVSLHGLHYASEGKALSTSAHDGIRWLPARLRDKGYYTMVVAANHQAIPTETAGFERVIRPIRPRWESSTMAAIVDHWLPLMRGLSERLRWRMPYADAKQIVDLTMAATPWGDQPLFLMVNVMDTHSPYNPPLKALRALDVEPANAFRRYRSHRALTRRWRSLPDTKTQSLVDLYDGELRCMDIQIGRLMEWIDRRFGENVVVIVTSDHGEELGEEGRIGHEYGLSQRIVHVPLVVRGPGITPGVIDSTVSVRMVDAFIDSASEGVTDLELFVRQDALGNVSERYPSTYNIHTLGKEYGRAWVSRFDGRYKAIGPSTSGFELLDVGDDTAFGQPRRASGADVETTLQEWIDDYWETYQDRREETTEFEQPTEKELRMLRSLGYID